MCLALFISFADFPDASAQQGAFVVPSIRAGGGTAFAYWDLFQGTPPFNTNYLTNNPPALFTGIDSEGNATNLASDVAFVQNGTSTGFVTSSGAIYSFSAATAFDMAYSPATPLTQDVNNVIFQMQSGGRRFDIDSIRLVYSALVGGVPQEIEVAPVYRALDDPQSGSFSERLMYGFQWDLTGLGVRDFIIRFAAPADSMPVWQAQLDVDIGDPFQQQLGYLLLGSALPVTRFDRPGTVEKDLLFGQEYRYFTEGQSIDLFGNPAPGWIHTGWLREGTVDDSPILNVTYATSDLVVTGLFAPTSYEAWRELIFFHANALTGQQNDYLNDVISGPGADPDHDGANNLAEYAFGGDPYTSDAGIMAPVMGVTQISGQNYATCTYRALAVSEFESDIAYTVRVSTNLSTWLDNDSNPTPVTEELSRVLQSDGSMLVTVRSLTPMAGQPVQFFTVHVE